MKCCYYACLAMLQFFGYSLHSQFYFSSNNRVEPELLWQAGAAAGVMNCLTDVGGGNGPASKFIKDLNWNQTQGGGGIFANADWHYAIGVKANAAFGWVAGSDAVLKNSSGAARNRYLRNLQFKTTIAEFSLAAEIYPSMFFANTSVHILSPYLVAGIGGFYYNPKALLSNKWIDLRPLHTEGEGFMECPERRVYSKISWSAPVGIGVKYDAAGLLNFRFEILYRFTGTDYLDDVSTKYIDPALFQRHLAGEQLAEAMQLADRSGEMNAGVKNNSDNIRGNPANKDAWFSAMLSASIVLGRVRHK